MSRDDNDLLEPIADILFENGEGFLKDDEDGDGVDYEVCKAVASEIVSIIPQLEEKRLPATIRYSTLWTKLEQLKNTLWKYDQGFIETPWEIVRAALFEFNEALHAASFKEGVDSHEYTTAQLREIVETREMVEAQWQREHEDDENLRTRSQFE